MCKTKVAFLEGQLLSSNQSNLKSIQKSPIDWKKAGPPKKLLSL